MVLGKKVAILFGNGAKIRPLEMGRTSPALRVASFMHPNMYVFMPSPFSMGGGGHITSPLSVPPLRISHTYENCFPCDVF